MCNDLSCEISVKWNPGQEMVEVRTTNKMAAHTGLMQAATCMLIAKRQLAVDA